MDVKMGVRTYLEEELQKARKSPPLRKDMYQKMIEIDCTAPTNEENEHKAVTKPRYMQWRDEMSSSVELGFRVEGIKKSDGNSSKDFKKTKTRDNVVDILKSFVGDNESIVEKYMNRLKEIMHTQEASEFFSSHEVVGSSLLFVHDADNNVGVWMIDFGKTEPLPNGVQINHRNQWQEGNHEDDSTSAVTSALDPLGYHWSSLHGAQLGVIGPVGCHWSSLHGAQLGVISPVYMGPSWISLVQSAWGPVGCHWSSWVSLAQSAWGPVGCHWPSLHGAQLGVIGPVGCHWSSQVSLAQSAWGPVRCHWSSLHGAQLGVIGPVCMRPSWVSLVQSWKKEWVGLGCCFTGGASGH
ncbi:hypothetical protein Btru_003157 [Bulinus truncatus]|nr:hypothetical protein Btru_003157 [Bulinus truncatus]